MKTPMILFALASLAPVPLLVAAALLGGGWALLALVYMLGFAALLDGLIAYATPPNQTPAEFPSGDGLSVTLALTHIALMVLAITALSRFGHGLAANLALWLAFGLFFGQVSNANAHELIHSGKRSLRALGIIVYISHGFGHHASAHPLVHHVHVATARDPNSARRGESYYRFLPRAWRGSFRAGWAAEQARLARAGRGWWRNPYLIYIGGALVWLAIAALIGGLRGMIDWMALAGLATAQLLLVDYVQHYGLRRDHQANGKPEPVGPRHSWNAPHWYSSAMTLNAPRHSDHHAHPGTRYPGLILPDGAPLLPRSLQIMATLALMPRTWRRVMDRRLDTLDHGS